MEYGCIGEHLKHSFSKEIHGALASYRYDIAEIERDRLSDFVKSRDFLGINVTIPYKEIIIPLLDFVDTDAKAIGAVNTVVNKDGRLYGYNTDFYGMKMLISHAKIEVGGKKVAILGTGGTSKTAYAVCSSLGAREILKVSREKKASTITYNELKEEHKDTEIIINTTPSGMFPNCQDKPVELSVFPSLYGVIDAIYNPLRSALISEAKELGIKAEGGLYMLVAQAVRASEIFLGKDYPQSTLDDVYKKILSTKENIVLIGMPASGKSTVGELLSGYLHRELIDTDIIVKEMAGKGITEIFAEGGESLFRNIESDAIAEASARTGAIIATGGGAVLRKNNVEALKRNGRLYFIDRPLDSLIPTDDRPLARDKDAIRQRFYERYPIYCASADVIIPADCDAECVAKKILGDYNGENLCN